MLTLSADCEIGGIKLSEDVTERLASYMEDMGVKFAEQVGIVHRRSVFQILIRILRLCPVDTGRLRGSWTTMMDAFGSNTYTKYKDSPSIGGGEPPKTPGKGFSDLAFNQGKSAGEFVDDYLRTTVGTNVVYADVVNSRNGYLTKGLVWGDTRYTANMEAFLEATALKEAVFNPITADNDGQAGS